MMWLALRQYTARAGADLQRLRTAESALRSSEERYRSLVETTTRGLFVVDRAGRIQCHNQRFAEIVGEPGTLIGRELTAFVEPEGQEAIRAALGNAGASVQRLEVSLPNIRLINRVPPEICVLASSAQLQHVLIGITYRRGPAAPVCSPAGPELERVRPRHTGAGWGRGHHGAARHREAGPTGATHGFRGRNGGRHLPRLQQPAHGDPGEHQRGGPGGRAGIRSAPARGRVPKRRGARPNSLSSCSPWVGQATPCDARCGSAPNGAAAGVSGEALRSPQPHDRPQHSPDQPGPARDLRAGLVGSTAARFDKPHRERRRGSTGI